MGSLVDIYRSWYPQTAANVDQRIASIGTLIQHHPDIAFRLVDRLAYVGHDSASHTHRPSWRDDDAGAGHGATGKECQAMLVAAAGWQIDLSRGNATRIATLIPKLGDFDQPRIEKVFTHCRELISDNCADDERELLRIALRNLLHQVRNYGGQEERINSEELDTLESLYNGLEPADLHVRHAWLFKESWPHLPGKVRGDNHKHQVDMIAQLRQAAISEIFTNGEFDSVSQLAKSTGGGWNIGVALAGADVAYSLFEKWIKDGQHTFERTSQSSNVISGVLFAMPKCRMLETLREVADHGNQASWRFDAVARFLTLAPGVRPVWELAEELSPQVEAEYWRVCLGNAWRQDSDADFQHCLQRLMDAKRPRTALDICHGQFDTIEPELIMQMLEGLLRGDESDGPRLSSYSIREAIQFLEKCGSIERARLIRLEFGLIPAFGYEGESGAKSLYHAIMNDPSLFIELICLLYKPRNRAEEELPDDSRKSAANTAWRVLHACKVQPGTREDDTIDSYAFRSFIKEVRVRAAEADRAEVCDSTLGQILAHAPSDEDGAWPFLPARDVLDKSDHEAMRNGFYVGTLNKRGVHSRGAFDGGDQEREIEEKYRAYAQSVHNSHPLVADTLNQIADTYKRDGISHDLEAKLRREGSW